MIVQNSAKQRARLDEIEAQLSGADEQWPALLRLVFDAAVAKPQDRERTWRRIPERHHDAIREDVLNGWLSVDAIAQRVEAEGDEDLRLFMLEMRANLLELLADPVTALGASDD